ncbi:MAG: hypothetical protein ACE5LX_01440 [Nitrospinota bacterium]
MALGACGTLGERKAKINFPIPPRLAIEPERPAKRELERGFFQLGSPDGTSLVCALPDDLKKILSYLLELEAYIEKRETLDEAYIDKLKAQIKIMNEFMKR